MPTVPRTLQSLLRAWKRPLPQLQGAMLPADHFGNMATMVCERYDPSCSQCSGSSNRNCLSCREGYVYLGQWGQYLKSCPPGYYKGRRSTTCHKCHPTCKTCSGEGALACLSCYDGFDFKRGIRYNPCFVGFYAASQDSESEKPNCKACDLSCEGCHGPSMRDCTLCPASQILSDDGQRLIW
ncbi:proprotein convertase subtilisin/kexin type 5-like [Odontesthes bonariensis]|uniref:proprotein convertase subtilisin/kexin type 5-like n=1 Tax=Odontesthes bonariensis TaxID=219752 RepID=UPI003F580C09